MCFSYHSLLFVQEHPYIRHDYGKGSYMNQPQKTQMQYFILFTS